MAYSITSGRRAGRASPLAVLLAAAMAAVLTAPWLFVTPMAEGREEAMAGAWSRRNLLLSGVAAGTAVASGAGPASAASFPGLGEQRGPFEVDPKEAVVVGDAGDKPSVDAKKTVQSLQDEAVTALASLQKDPQTDLVPMIKPLGISDLRRATNTINNLMDDSSAAGTQRLQRLMIQTKFQMEEDLPMPISKKGVVQPRGEKRLGRIEEALKNYITYSKQLLEFVP